jgi:PleD family two-component response regulator
MSRLDDVKEESDAKSHQSYGVLNKSWGDSGDKKSSSVSKTALVVDDGAMCRKACGAMLQEMGFKVEFANDGKEAVDKIFREDVNTGVIAVTYYEVRPLSHDFCHTASIPLLSHHTYRVCHRYLYLLSFVL